MTTRRSRSGRQVRTTTSDRRAVARQSMERTSSPTTYSRNESNSVPRPRTRTGSSPSISRSRASRDGRCLRDRNGGSTRTVPASATDRCRPASPSGPIARNVTAADCRSPRRVGRSLVGTVAEAPRASISGWLRGSASALGGQASRTAPRNRRLPSLPIVMTVSTDSPSRTEAGPDRRRTSASGRAARAVSVATAIVSATANIRKAVAGQGATAIGRTAINAISAVRPVRTTSAGPPPRRGCRPGRRPPWHLPVRPPGASRSGAAGSAGPSP